MSGLLPALGGGAANVVQLAAGGLSGIIAMSALIASGIVSIHPAPPPAGGLDSLGLLACPDAGSLVAIAEPGDRMLVTGRSTDGAWLRVYVPGPVSNDGWAPAATITLLADGSSLPVAACPTGHGASSQPSPSLEAPSSPSPSQSPSDPPGPTPTATPIPTPGAVPTATATAVPPPTATPRPLPTPTATPRPLPTPTPTPAPTRQ